MWVNKQLFDMIVADNKAQAAEITDWKVKFTAAFVEDNNSRVQKTKDDATIDWMRHRVNALEKQNTVLMGKAGLHFPTPEIVQTRPGTMGGTPDFDSIPSFEDVGDHEAVRMGISHDADGNMRYTK